MNTNLLNALKEIVSRYGGVETLSDARRVKALLADLAAAEPKPQKNALIAGLEQGFAAMLQNVPAHERGAAKAKLAERLNREEGLDAALCADTLDLLEEALLGIVSVTTAAVAPTAPAAAPKTPAPQKPEISRTVEQPAVIPAVQQSAPMPKTPAKPPAKKKVLGIALAAAVVLVIVAVYASRPEEKIQSQGGSAAQKATPLKLFSGSIAYEGYVRDSGIPIRMELTFENGEAVRGHLAYLKYANGDDYRPMSLGFFRQEGSTLYLYEYDDKGLYNDTYYKLDAFDTGKSTVSGSFVGEKTNTVFDVVLTRTNTPLRY
jgi:hypothetical protein